MVHNSSLRTVNCNHPRPNIRKVGITHLHYFRIRGTLRVTLVASQHSEAFQSYNRARATRNRGDPEIHQLGGTNGQYFLASDDEDEAKQGGWPDLCAVNHKIVCVRYFYYFFLGFDLI